VQQQLALMASETAWRLGWTVGDLHVLRVHWVLTALAMGTAKAVYIATPPALHVQQFLSHSALMVSRMALRLGWTVAACHAPSVLLVPLAVFTVTASPTTACQAFAQYQ